LIGGSTGVASGGPVAVVAVGGAAVGGLTIWLGVEVFRLGIAIGEEETLDAALRASRAALAAKAAKANKDIVDCDPKGKPRPDEFARRRPRRPYRRPEPRQPDENISDYCHRLNDECLRTRLSRYRGGVYGEGRCTLCLGSCIASGGV